ncbi:MAG: hypothetical protein AAF160_12910 [Pseudomonadota bacterium]
MVMFTSRALIAPLLAALLASPGAASQDVWRTRAVTESMAISSVSLGRIYLQLQCYRGVENQVLSLIAARGFPGGLKRKDRRIALEISLPGGGVRTHTAWMILNKRGRALTGRIPLDTGFLEDFARGSRLRVLFEGKALVTAGLTGTSDARNAFAEICGI